MKNLMATKAPPKKMYHSISEVAKMTGLEQHVLRYWESEFPKLRPRKNRAGNRQFRDKDIQIIKYIKHLLYSELYTIQGAKKKIMESDHKELEGQLNLLSDITDTPKPVANDAQLEQKDKQIKDLQSKIEKQSQIIELLKNELLNIKKLLSGS